MTKIYLTSSKNIKTLRIRQGYSVDELAEAANISTKFLYNIEAGKAGFSAKILFNIAKALNVSCDFILTGEGSNEGSMIIEIIKQFDESEQRHIEGILLSIIQMKSDKK